MNYFNDDGAQGRGSKIMSMCKTSLEPLCIRFVKISFEINIDNYMENLYIYIYASSVQWFWRQYQTFHKKGHKWHGCLIT